jgi:hypothetical protein
MKLAIAALLFAIIAFLAMTYVIIPTVLGYFYS